MLEIGNNERNACKSVIRMSKQEILLAVQDAQSEFGIATERYTVDQTQPITQLKNILETSKIAHFLTQGTSLEGQKSPISSGFSTNLIGNFLQILVDSATLLIPSDLFESQQTETLFRHTFPSVGKDKKVVSSTMKSLGSVLVFAIDAQAFDLLQSRFPHVDVAPVMQPIWKHCSKKNLSGLKNDLFAYFHDGKTDVFCFENNGFRFSNQFITHQSRDAVNHILSVWQEVDYDNVDDELLLLDVSKDEQWLLHSLRRVLQRVYTLNPKAEFNRATIAQADGVPLDVITYFLEGK